MMIDKLQHMRNQLNGEEFVLVGDSSRMPLETPISFRSDYSGIGDIPVTVTNSNDDEVKQNSTSMVSSRKEMCHGALDKHKVESKDKRDGKYSV